MSDFVSNSVSKSYIEWVIVFLLKVSPFFLTLVLLWSSS